MKNRPVKQKNVSGSSFIRRTCTHSTASNSSGVLAEYSNTESG